MILIPGDTCCSDILISSATGSRTEDLVCCEIIIRNVVGTVERQVSIGTLGTYVAQLDALILQAACLSISFVHAVTEC